jgi:hypothetical protein
MPRNALDMEVGRCEVLPDALRLRRDRPDLLPLLLHRVARVVGHLCDTRRRKGGKPELGFG